MLDTQVLADIRERMVRVETKIDAMTDVRATANEAQDTAREALLSTKSAHLRIDEVADNQKWLWRTVIGGVIAVVIAYISNLGGVQ